MQFLASSPKALLAIPAAGMALFATKKYFNGGTCHETADLKEKVVVITGANTGIGKETAIELAKMGARVIMACRSAERTKPAVADVQRLSGNPNVEFMELDLSDLESVRAFARTFSAKYQKLHLLINNAGVMALPTRQTTKQGLEMQIGTNHFGHFLLTNLLLDRLKQSTPSRVVNVSSLAHERGTINFDDINWEKPGAYSAWKAYEQSKLANVVFTNELQRRLEGTGVTTISLHPGVVRTELSRYMLEGSYVLRGLATLMYPVFWLLTKDSLQGAQTSIHAAVSKDFEKSGGVYLSDCAVKKSPNPLASDLGVGKKFWELSEKLVGL